MNLCESRGPAAAAKAIEISLAIEGWGCYISDITARFPAVIGD